MEQTTNIVRSIEGSKTGTIFFVSDFAVNGNDKYISRVLSQDCVAKGILLKIANGIYFKPAMTSLGVLKPSVDNIAKAIAKRDGADILPTGETAMCQLGFSTQVPMKYVYLTSGSDRCIAMGEHTLKFLHRTPKNFAYKGELMPMLVQALRAIGQEKITDKDKRRTKEILRIVVSKDEWNDNAALPPCWIKKLLTGLKKELDNE